MLSKTLQVSHATGQYEIYIGTGLLKDKAFLNDQIVSTQVCVVTNTCVADLYLETVLSHFSDKRCDHIVLPDGEAHKTFENFMQIIDFLCEQEHHRDTTLMALGGGVVGDMTGFAAACYHRGVAFVQVPTTLLSQVDASIGGKTAVNHPLGKNLVGAFYQPRAVIIDLDTLDTLPDREYLAGLAEIIKAALIQDADFFSWLEAHSAELLNRDKATLEAAVFRSCEIKRAIVMRDEREQGERAVLNFGHTFGHAIEHCLGYGEWLHGEAVALGMLMAAACSQQQGLISVGDYQRIYDLLVAFGYEVTLPKGLCAEALSKAMLRDKKVYKDRLHLILLNHIGSARITNDIPADQLQQLMTHYESDRAH